MSENPKQAQTRELLLQNGLELFNRQGYHGTGLKEILAAAGVPKGSFYHYFDSKEHFAVEIIHHYRALEFKRWESKIKGSEGDRLAEMRRCISTLIDEYDAQEQKVGCLIANLSGELAACSPYFRSAIQASSEEVLDLMEADFATAQQQGSVRRDLPPRALACLFWDAWQGAMLRMKVNRSTTPLRQVAELLFDNLLKAPHN
ncbi:TetR/AcrR family transcriptional regulator [Motiliproteus sp. SC1-56]|uniref:TetR/AcrR family transcriptional regulator n=1 Tax=Motiliproteus sp. SC1-56 TaxID=2799565 RepID=UPI001A8EB440|nr:TetR/AcrR family transcriptional regulator [Motiliproteus sp. SC1-56]